MNITFKNLDVKIFHYLLKLILKIVYLMQNALKYLQNLENY